MLSHTEWQMFCAQFFDAVSELMYGSVLPGTKLTYHVMGQRVPSRVMPMNEKKEKSQCQIRFPYRGAAAVIRSTAEIYKAFSVDDELYVCSNDPDCKSYVAI